MIIVESVYFHPARHQRPIHIYLPDDYEYSNERYPVMYMFDGHNLFYDSYATYGKSWGLKEYLDQWHKKIIIVGLECNHKGNNRLKEFSPYYWNTGDFAGEVYGTGDKTMNWMVKHLKPYIDEKYRTWSHREATGIGGSSMGGLMSLYAAIQHNKTFSKAACLSSAITFCSKELRELIKDQPLHPDTRIYLSWGANEGWGPKGKIIYNSVHQAINRDLLKKGLYPPMLYKQPKGNHCEADWEKQNSIYMPYLWL